MGEPSVSSVLLSEQADDLISYAWTIIANAGEGNWEREAADWQEAAKRWRSQYHAYLDVRPSRPVEDESSV